MAPSSKAVSSNGKDQKSAGSPQYGKMITKVTSRMKQLQEELALESVTNIEFEESSRRSFEFLTEQVRTVKETCNTLTDTFLQELEHISGAISGEFFRLEDGLLKDLANGIEKAEKGIEKAEKGVEKAEKGIEEVEEKAKIGAGEQMRKNELLERLIEQLDRKIEQKIQQLGEQLERKNEQLDRKIEQLGELFGEQMERKSEQFGEQLEREQLERKNEQLVQMEKDAETKEKIEKQERKNEQLEKRIDLLTEELESVLSVIPKIEDNMLRTNHHFQDRLEAVSEFVNGQVAERLEQLSQNFQDVSKESATSVKHLAHLETGLLSMEEGLLAQIQRAEDGLREEFEQKILKIQRHVTRQLEGMNRVLTEESLPKKGAPQITMSNMGGGTFGSERAYSPLNANIGNADHRELPVLREQAWSDASDRSPLRIPGVESRRLEQRANVTALPERPERRDNDTASFQRRDNDTASFQRRDVGTASYRSGLTGSGYEAFRADRIGLGNAQDSPEQSTRRGSMDDAPNRGVDLRSGFGGQDRPYLGRKDHLGPAAQVGASKPGHIQVDFDLSGLQGASPAARGLH